MATFRFEGTTRSRILGLLVVSVAPLLVGCGMGGEVELSAKTAAIHPVSGKIVGVGSGSVAGAKISLMPKDLTSGARLAVGEIKADGSFDLTTEKPGDGAAEGTYKVKIDPPPSKSGLNAKNTAIPARYQDEDGSGIELTIDSSTSSIPPIKLSAAPPQSGGTGRAQDRD